MMRTLITVLLLGLCSLACTLAIGQSVVPVIRVGAAAGGPIPPTMDQDSMEGKLAIGPYASLAVQGQATQRIRWEVGLQYLTKGATYRQLFRQDTSVVIELLPGISDTLPTFYTADVTGRMSLHHLELPVMAHLSLGKVAYVSLGVAPSLWVAGQDTGNVHVVIGEGGFFDDVDEPFDNAAVLRRWSCVASVGGGVQLPSGWLAELRVHRSLTAVYDPALFASRGVAPNNPFQTQMSLAVGWRWTSKGHL